MFASAMCEVLPYMGITPKYTEQEMKEYGIKVPNMVGRDVNDAKNELINIGLKPVVIGNGKTIVSQVPGANSNSTKDSSVFLYTE